MWPEQYLTYWLGNYCQISIKLCHACSVSHVQLIVKTDGLTIIFVLPPALLLLSNFLCLRTPQKVIYTTDLFSIPSVRVDTSFRHVPQLGH